ncbi:hypothetical protein V6N11_075654 [Hibiscus sabdariffa]|uniref:CCHC-type domain-containing protein n=1 Tax=Hibiscus sabdariffa TaxID=183260 RepID=A0ABR2N6U7_9ROSI
MSSKDGSVPSRGLNHSFCNINLIINFIKLIITGSAAEQFVTLEIPSEFPKGWIESGYSHIHFGAIRLALNYHGVEGKPVVARIALLDTRYLKYQDACIGTVEATMNNGLVMITLFPNFTMALEDPNLMDALKVQIHIIGAQQVESSIIATLHYQIVYRVQDHAFRLGGCGSNDSLLITVNTQEQPHCVHIPRQIPRDELIQLLPKRWVTSYDQIHAIKQPIRSTNTKIISKGDGTSEIRFDHSHLKDSPTPPVFPTQMMMTPRGDLTQTHDKEDSNCCYNPHRKKKNKKKNSIHSQLYQRWKNGDSTVGPLGEDNGKFVFLVDYGPRKKEEIPDPDAVPQTLPRSDSSPPPSYKKKPVQPVQPCYKKIQKWIKKNPVIQKEVSHTHTQSICMFTPTGSSYNKDFPPLEEFIENEFRHIPKIPTQLHREKISTAEATLNWQTENALAQNATLQRINARVVQMDTKITMVETKVDSNTKIANELIVNLHRMLREAERRSADPGQDPFYYVEQKNQEIQRLKDYIKYLQEHGLPPSAQPGEVLFPDRSAPSSVFSPFERRTPPSLPSVFHRQPVEPKRLAPYELRELIRKQEADQKREREERERKGKSHAVHEEEEPVPKVSRSMMIRDGQQNPLSSFLKGYKEAIIPRIAAINTEETEQSSKSESSDDSQSIETQSSSDDEIQMAIPDVKTEEVEVDPMDTDASPSASAPPPFQINSGKHTFTLDDIPSTRWPQRLQEFQAWMDTQKLTRESNYEILSEFVSRFTGMLRDWWNTLSQPDQVVFLTRQSFLEVLQILHKFFLGNQDDLKTLKKKEFFKRKCCSPERRDLQKHFTIMAKLFYFLGADPNLKHTILASIPEILQNAVSRHLQSTGKRVENLTIGEIQQETYMALEEICDRKKIIKNYLTGSKEIARACRDTKLQIKCKEKEDCHCRQKMKFRSRRNDQRPFRTPAYPRSLRRKRKWRYLRKKQPQGQKSSRCYICGKQGHFAKRCPKNKQGAKMIQMIQQKTGIQIHEEDDVESIFSIDDEPNDNSLFAIQSLEDNTDPDSDLSSEEIYMFQPDQLFSSSSIYYSNSSCSSIDLSRQV